VPAELRATFDEDAERYDRARPSYPVQLFDDLCELAQLDAGSRVLEIGCGTGQATVPLARRGMTIVAVELGANLAAVARRNLESYPNVDVVVDVFEDWPLPDEPFDAVVAFTAIRWLDAERALPKIAAALRPGGAFVVVNTEHVAGGTAQFFVDAQDCYERWDPETPAGLRLEPSAAFAERVDLAADPEHHFGDAELRCYETDRVYTTDTYLDVLQTYSGMRAMDASALDGLLACIGELMDSRYGGMIVKRYLRTMRVARLDG
jgi:SAM-dependent methyltransferase